MTGAVRCVVRESAISSEWRESAKAMTMSATYQTISYEAIGPLQRSSSTHRRTVRPSSPEPSSTPPDLSGDGQGAGKFCPSGKTQRHIGLLFVDDFQIKSTCQATAVASISIMMLGWKRRVTPRSVLTGLHPASAKIGTISPALAMNPSTSVV